MEHDRRELLYNKQTQMVTRLSCWGRRFSKVDWLEEAWESLTPTFALNASYFYCCCDCCCYYISLLPTLLLLYRQSFLLIAAQFVIVVSHFV